MKILLLSFHVTLKDIGNVILGITICGIANNILLIIYIIKITIPSKHNITPIDKNNGSQESKSLYESKRQNNPNII